MKIKSDTTEAKVYHEFLQTEWYKDHFRQFENNGLTPDGLDPENPIDAGKVKQLLLSLRSPVLSQLPENTTWYIAEFEDNDFENLLVIRELGWEQTFGPNKKLSDVALALSSGVQEQGGVNFPLIYDIKSNIGTHEFKERLILISKGLNGPFTILEGNHRAVAFQLEIIEKHTTAHLPREVIIATSENMQNCVWLNYA